MNKVIMYSTQVCPYCQMAERLLKSRGVEHIEKVLIDRDPARREEMMTRTGRLDAAPVGRPATPRDLAAIVRRNEI